MLAKFCLDCHGGKGKPEGGPDLAKLSEAAKGLVPGKALDPKTAAVWRDVLTVVRAGEMPPDGSPKLPAADRARLIASRLSYFLWASMPDDELLAAAAVGKLKDPAELERQTRRMLRDPKVRELSETFAVQWLRLNELWSAQPDRKMLKAFYAGPQGKGTLHADLMTEALLRIETILVEDRSVLEFVDADWGYLNKRVIQHYGLAESLAKEMEAAGMLAADDRTGLAKQRQKNSGAERIWLRIKWPDRNRGGAITTGAVLTPTSLPQRTSPVKRGAWVLETLLNRPPKPPAVAAFVYMPNGVWVKNWFPAKAGNDWEITPSLEPLAGLRGDVALLGGLDRSFVAGTGVHAQCGACRLTSSAPTEVLDGGFPTNVSLDQMIAKHVGGDTPLPSLELSCNDHADNKETKYFESISWYGPGYAANVEKNPRAVFQRLFGKPRGDAVTRSVLDAVREDAAGLAGRLGTADRRKLDESLDSVRSTERRIQLAEKAAARRTRPPIAEPAGIPDDRGAYLRLMGDLIVLAFQQDLTRVATLLIDPERWDSPRMYHGVFDKPQNHHVLTHTKGDEAKAKLARIDRFHVEQFAYVVRRLREIPEGAGRLLDNCCVVLGSGISDGDSHNYKDLPVVIAGRAGGRLRTGSYHAATGEIPLANLWLTLLHAMGGPADRFADSTGPVKGLPA